MARSRKPLTYSQAQARKAQAVRFTRDVVGDPARAAEIEAESRNVLDRFCEVNGLPPVGEAPSVELLVLIAQTLEWRLRDIRRLRTRTIAELGALLEERGIDHTLRIKRRGGGKPRREP